MSGGVSFQESGQDQVNELWHQIQHLVRENEPGWQRRSEQTSHSDRNNSSEITTVYANGCTVVVARHYTGPGREYFRDTVMRIVLPPREENRDVPPSPANASNRRLLGVPASPDLAIAGQPVMIRSRDDFEAMFGSRPSPARQSGDEVRQQMGRRDPPPAPVLPRFPNAIEMRDIQACMTALLSGRSVEVREDRGMPVWLCRHQWASDGTTGQYRAGPEAYKMLSALQASIIAADQELREADHRAATQPFDGGRVRRRLLDT